MDKNMFYPILSLVLVVLVAGAVYFIAGMFGGTQIHEGTHEEEHEEGLPEELFFKAILSPLQYSEYTYAYEEVSSNGYTSSIFLTSAENYSYVMKEDAISTRKLIIQENSTILCLENVNRRLCSLVSQNSSFKPYTHTLQALLFDRETIQKTEEFNELFVQYGAIVFGSEVVETSYLGRECSEISYILDYGKLTVEQMWEVGMSPDSPEVLVSKDFRFTLCIDPESGDVLHKFLSYSVFGENYSTESLTTQLLWETPSEVEFPSNFSSEEDMEEFFSALKMSQDNYRRCLAQEDVDMCIRGEAILSRNERLCELILNTTSKDICYVNVALEKDDESLCRRASEETQDGCFMEFTWKHNDAVYCDEVSEEKKEECLELVTQEDTDSPDESGEPETPAEDGSGEEEPPEDEAEEQTEYGSECVSDSDCVRAGRFSQLCVPSSQWDIVTSREEFPEYACLKFTSCGCSAGMCSLEMDSEYSSCIEQIV